jgi:hypothetical protein
VPEHASALDESADLQHLFTFEPRNIALLPVSNAAPRASTRV